MRFTKHAPPYTELTKKVILKNKERAMELLLSIKLEDKDYEVREYPDTGTLLIVRKGMKGEPDYSMEGEGFVVEFKDGEIYTVDVYDPELASKVKESFCLQIT